MYKNFLCPILISLLISSCANQRNSSDRWDKKQITSACDCADMAVDFFTEMIDDVKRNPEMTEESIMNSKEAVWKPRFELCDELEKERRKSETSSFEEELEQCESAKELRSLMDTLARLVQPEADWEIPENDSSTEICECLVAANSEEEALQCAPDKTIDELMEMLTSDCLEMAVDRYEEEYPVEEPTEEALKPNHEIESEKRTEESSNTDSKMQIKENGKEMILKSLHEELAYLEEELGVNQGLIQELKQDIKEVYVGLLFFH